MNEWWKDAFDEKYFVTHTEQLPAERTEQEVRFIVEKLKLPKGARILDMPCGHGRHSIELAKQGFEIVGVDYSQTFIDRAKCDADSQGVEVDWQQGDMRKQRFRRKFDAVLNLFTSFGYFDDPDNERALQVVAEALKPGGLFLLDAKNPGYAEKQIGANGGVEKDGIMTATRELTGKDGVQVQVTDQRDAKTQRWMMQMRWQHDGKEEGYDTSIRMYSLDELIDMLGQCGLEVKEVWGDYEGNEYDKQNSPRILILARK